MKLEGLPNRNSFPYLKLYRLGGLRTFVRGTLRYGLLPLPVIASRPDLVCLGLYRYSGYSSLLYSFKKLGLLNNKKKILPQDWNALVRESMLAEYVSEDGLIPSLPQVIKAENLQALQDALDWLGLATPTLFHGTGYDLAQSPKPMPPLPVAPATPLSIFAHLLSHKLRYQSTDKDMVVLSHEIISTDLDYRSGPEQVHTSTLVTYGTDKMHTGFQGERPASAMARTVGFPAAIAAMLIVQGKLDGLVGHGCEAAFRDGDL